MTTFFIYLLKVSCWVAVWWLIYYFFLRKETFYTFNRFYLMSGLAASFLIPLIKIHYPVEIFITQTVNTNAAEKTNLTNTSVDLLLILFYIYSLCVAFFIFRQIFLLLKVNKMIRGAGYTSLDKYRLVDSAKTEIPFSFFKYIFINGKIQEKERQLIIAHECSHITQCHWVDLVISECVCILLWFNPFMWLYLRSIKENHEYLADEAVICNGYSQVYYRATLINQTLNTSVFPLVNSFAQYSFKRISMMKKEASNPLKKLTIILLVPAIAFFLWAFSEPEYNFTTIEAHQQTEDVYFQDSVSIIFEKQENEQPLIKHAKASIQNDSINNNLNPTESIKVKNGVMLVTTKRTNNFRTAKDTSKIIVRTLSRTQHLPEDSTITKIRNFSFRSYSTAQNEPLILIDGVISSMDIKEIDPKSIESITVLKNETAVQYYGEKGKNGVILITTKKPLI